MTPQEKANELMDKFLHPVRWKMGQEDIAQRTKQCALIAVDEIIDTLTVNVSPFFSVRETIKYWQEVKQELDK